MSVPNLPTAIVEPIICVFDVRFGQKRATRVAVEMQECVVQIVFVDPQRMLPNRFVEPDSVGVIDSGFAFERELILPDGGVRRQCNGAVAGPYEAAGLECWRARPCPFNEAVRRHEDERAAISVTEPS